MGKYLIQDIVPSEKKRRSTLNSSAHKLTEKDTDSAEGGHSLHHSTPSAENPRKMILNQIGGDRAQHGEHETKSSQRTAHHATGKKSSLTKPWTYDPSINEEEESTTPPPPSRLEGFSSRGGWERPRSPWLPWLIGIAVVAILTVFLLNYFAGATVTILPKHDTPVMNNMLSAQKDPKDGELPYAIMIETASSSIEVPATGEKTVTVKAAGNIIVYNEQTSAQRLIKNTRFQSPAGKIYRINDSINVPKATIAGGRTTPGSLEVTISADEAGPEYNSDPTDFTLPGLKSSPAYNKVYARSKGAISGGARGVIKTVSDQDLKQSGEDLRVQLETKLRSKARGDLATNQITYDQGILVALGEPSLSKAPASADNKAIVTEEGTIYLVTFKRADLMQAIVKSLVQGYKGEPVNIKNLDSLKFSMDEQKGDALVTANKLSFTLSGNPQLTWIIDDAAIKKALLGVPKGGFNGILAQFPSVERAKATIRPMWKNSFPNDAKQISVVLVDQMSD